MPAAQSPLDNNSRKSSDTVTNAVNRIAGGQSVYRSIGSAWLLAGLGAISFLLIETEPCSRAFLFSPGFVIAAVSALTSFGLALLWYQDQFVYQRLLNSAFTYGLFLEFKDMRLPQMRTSLYAQTHNISRHLSLYYFFPILFLFLIGAFAAKTDSLNIDCVPVAGAQQSTEATAEIAPADRAALDKLERCATDILLLFHGLIWLGIGIYVVLVKHSIANDIASKFPSEFQRYLKGELTGDTIGQRLGALEVDTSIPPDET